MELCRLFLYPVSSLPEVGVDLGSDNYIDCTKTPTEMDTGEVPSRKGVTHQHFVRVAARSMRIGIVST